MKTKQKDTKQNRFDYLKYTAFWRDWLTPSLDQIAANTDLKDKLIGIVIYAGWGVKGNLSLIQPIVGWTKVALISKDATKLDRSIAKSKLLDESWNLFRDELIKRDYYSFAPSLVIPESYKDIVTKFS